MTINFKWFLFSFYFHFKIYCWYRNIIIFTKKKQKNSFKCPEILNMNILKLLK